MNNRNGEDFEIYGYNCSTDSISMKKRVYASSKDFIDDYYNNGLDEFRTADLIRTVSYKGKVISKTFSSIEEAVKYFKEC